MPREDWDARHRAGAVHQAEVTVGELRTAHVGRRAAGLVPGAVPAPRPGSTVRPSADLGAELAAEAAWLGARLGHPVVRARGAAGVLNPVVRSAVWVHGPAVDTGDLVGELLGCPLVPDVMVLDGLAAPRVDLQPLVRAGWQPVALTDQVRHEAPAVLGVADQGHPLVVRPVRAGDLGAVRDLVDTAFATTDAALHLPDGVLDVPDLVLWLARTPDGALVGTCGVRLRHAGALVFGLAVAPEARRAGTARRLVAACGGWAAARGAAYVLADTEPGHAALWGGLGFRPAARWQRWSIG